MVTDTNTEMKVSRKQPIRFYMRAAEAFFRGTVKTAKSEAKPAVENMTISALGNAINTAIACATNLERNDLAEVVQIETNYTLVKGGGGNVNRRSPQIQIQMKRNPNAPGPIDYGADERNKAGAGSHDEDADDMEVEGA